MQRGLMPIGVYTDGRTWKHGSPKRYRKRSPNRKDKLMGYFERKAMERGLLPTSVYLDGRTWRHGQPSPYAKKRRSSKKQ